MENLLSTFQKDYLETRTPAMVKRNAPTDDQTGRQHSLEFV